MRNYETRENPLLRIMNLKVQTQNVDYFIVGRKNLPKEAIFTTLKY
jgi:hypothetical protein